MCEYLRLAANPVPLQVLRQLQKRMRAPFHMTPLGFLIAFEDFALISPVEFAVLDVINIVAHKLKNIHINNKKQSTTSTVQLSATFLTTSIDP